MDTPQDVPDTRKARLHRRERVLLSVFFALALLVGINFRRVEVRGASMEPTFHSGDVEIVWKTVARKSLKPGDIIVFRSTDGDELIKRIAAIGGGPNPAFPDWLTLPGGRREAVGALFSPENSPYVYARVSHQLPPPAPERTIYVLGDNLPRSDDSRAFGPIAPAQILGKVIP